MNKIIGWYKNTKNKLILKKPQNSTGSATTRLLVLSFFSLNLLWPEVKLAIRVRKAKETIFSFINLWVDVKDGKDNNLL